MKTLISSSATRFSGFTPETCAFLRDIATHNAKPWLEAHRSTYEQHILQPLRALVSDLTPAMVMIDPEFEVRPSIGKTISRIRRDTRFSRNKSPYRDTAWITFKRPRTDWQDAPAFFFEISADGYRYGMGFYAAHAATMAVFREGVDEQPEVFARAISWQLAKENAFALEGDTYKRPMPHAHPDTIGTWYNRKNFYVVANAPIDGTLYSSALVTNLARAFHTLEPLYHFLLRLKQKK